MVVFGRRERETLGVIRGHVIIPDKIGGMLVTSIGEDAFQDCTSLTSVAIPSSVTRIKSYAFSGCTSLTSVAIPSSVTRIESYAFSGCTSLTSVAIPSSVTRIESCAFHGCTSLTSVAIPSSVTRIGEGAFRGCSISLLVKFTVPMRRLFAYQRNDSSNLFRVFDYLFEFLSWQDVARITTVSKCFYSNIIVRCRRDFFYQRCI